MTGKKQDIIDTLEGLLRTIHEITPSQRWMELRTVDECVQYIENVLTEKAERFGYPVESDCEVINYAFHVIGMKVDSLLDNIQQKEEILSTLIMLQKEIEIKFYAKCK